MAFTTGNAEGHNDLLDRVRTFLTSNGWTSLAYTSARLEATSMDSVASGGTGYAVSDTITLAGGTQTTRTVLTVTSVSSGAVTGANITTRGVYTVAPTDPVAQFSTSGGGSGATFNMTYLPAVDTDVATLSLEGPGNGASARVYVNIETFNNVGSNHYTWKVFGATSYSAGVGFPSQVNASPEVHFLLANTTLEYWIQSSTRRFMVEARSGSNYLSMYAGFMLPFALPSEYPFPLAIIASYPTAALPGVANARNSSIADPGDAAAHYLRRSALTWRAIRNQGNAGTSISPVTGQRAFMWPAKSSMGTSASAGDADLWNSGGWENMKTNFNSEAPLVRCTLIDTFEAAAVAALEGVFMTTGFGRSAEQALTVGGRTFRLFQRAGRTGPGDFFAVEEE